MKKTGSGSEKQSRHIFTIPVIFFIALVLLFVLSTTVRADTTGSGIVNENGKNPQITAVKESAVDIALQCSNGNAGQSASIDTVVKNIYADHTEQERIKQNDEDGTTVQDLKTFNNPDGSGAHLVVMTFATSSGGVYNEITRQSGYDANGTLLYQFDRINGKDVDYNDAAQLAKDDTIFTPDFATAGTPPSLVETATALDNLRYEKCGCPNGQTDCPDNDGNHHCTDTSKNNWNCGHCGNACPSGQTCSGGQCACPSGETNCSGHCTDTSNDPWNCGSGSSGCGNVCPSGQICSNSQCSCPTGETDMLRSLY